MIVVSGASGTYGRGVVEALLRRMPAEQIGVSVRDQNKVADLAAKGVRVREASFDDPSAVARAFEGADQAVIVSTDVMGEQGVARCRNAVRAAVDAGVGRIVYTSHMGCSPTSAFQACIDHSQIEEVLAQGRTPWTSLRNGFYALSAWQFAEHGIASGTIAVPADGPVSWTTHDDLVEGAATILTAAQPVDGPTAPLTAQQCFTFDDIAAAASEATGRDITRVVVGDDEFVQGMVGHGAPDAVARQLLGIFVAARKGEFAATSPRLGELIGHQPTTMTEVVGRELA